jgi:hypothetical protein
MAVTKVLHISDVHLEDGFPGVPVKSFMNKRIVGLANLRFRRRRVFAEAAQKVEALSAFSKEQRSARSPRSRTRARSSSHSPMHRSASSPSPATTTSICATRLKPDGSTSTSVRS